jgi:hypothetical protein
VDRAIDALEPTAVEHDAKPVVLVFPASDGVGSNAEGAFAAAESRIEKMSLWKEPAAEVVPEPAAPVEVVARATRLLEQDSRRLRAPVGAEWRRPAAALAAAAGLTVVVFLAASRISLPAPAPSDAPRAEAANRASDVAGSLPVAAAAEAPAPTAAAGDRSRRADFGARRIRRVVRRRDLGPVSARASRPRCAARSSPARSCAAPPRSSA